MPATQPAPLATQRSWRRSLSCGDAVRAAGAVRRDRADPLRDRWPAADPRPAGTAGFAPSRELVKALAEITLVLVLFSDASRVRRRDLRTDLGLCLRLLGIGLPLTIGLGTLPALALFNGMSIWPALPVGAALAPTDAALGAVVMVNPAVPARIRQLLSVESGLNDGIATPVVLVAIAGAAEQAASVGPAAAAADLALGVLVGVFIGGAGGVVVNVARRRG